MCFNVSANVKGCVVEVFIRTYSIIRTTMKIPSQEP